MHPSPARPTVAWLVLAGLTALAGCKPGPAVLSRQNGGRIAVVGAGAGDPLWPVVRCTTARFARSTSLHTIEAITPESASFAAQEAVVRDLVAQGVRGICIQVMDPTASRSLLESLRAEGIVIVTLLHEVPSADPFLHSGIDAREMGVALAEALADAIPSDGTVAIVCDPSDTILEARQRGFGSEMAHSPRLTVLRELDCRGSATEAIHLMREAMERFPGIDGWAAMAPWPLAHPEAGSVLPQGCRLVVPAPLPDAAGEIISGRCHAVVMADFTQIVTRGLELCLAAFAPTPPPVRIHHAPLWAVTAKNLPEFERVWATWTAETEGVPQS